MSKKAAWPWWQQYNGSDGYRIRELLRAVNDLHAYYGDPDTWVWRGQPSAHYKFDAAAHTRVDLSGRVLDDDAVKSTTSELLRHARSAGLNAHEGLALPDMALLALLQHHGAATPLIDVSLDPMVALYMAVVSPDPKNDSKDGVLFAIKKPPEPAKKVDAVQPFDTRTFDEIYDRLAESPIFYSAPDVSDRLRIQRGHFLLGRLSDEHQQVRVGLTLDSARTVPETWLAKRMEARGKTYSVPATTDLAAFRVPAKFKPALQDWLEKRTGLTTDFVYPSAWHRPHLDVFAKSHGRNTHL